MHDCLKRLYIICSHISSVAYCASHLASLMVEHVISVDSKKKKKVIKHANVEICGLPFVAPFGLDGCYCKTKTSPKADNVLKCMNFLLIM